MNEKIFIVSIGLNRQSDKEKFETYEFGMGRPFRIMEGVYAIKTPFNTSSDSLRDKVVSILIGQCYVFVMKASIEAAWRVAPEVDTWLRNNI